MFQRLLLLSIFIIFGFTSCKKKTEEKPVMSAENGTYFSIKQFTVDQWNTFRGQPFGLVKVNYMNGETDTSYTNAFELNWGEIFKVFFETDISDPKYLGQYNFSSFNDDVTYTKNFYYEARDPKLFTQKLQVSADEVTNKIRSIYIETSKNSVWTKRSQKLFYQPLKSISIQEFEWSKTGPKKELRIEYRFL